MTSGSWSQPAMFSSVLLAFWPLSFLSSLPLTRVKELFMYHKFAIHVNVVVRAECVIFYSYGWNLVIKLACCWQLRQFDARSWNRNSCSLANGSQLRMISILIFEAKITEPGNERTDCDLIISEVKLGKLINSYIF